MPFRIGWQKTRNWFVHLLRLDASAHRIALGAAIGAFIAMTPTVGVQMLLVFIVTSAIPANRAAGLPMVWITNPATIVPIYSFNLFIGIQVTGGSHGMLIRFQEAVTSLVHRDLTWWALIKEWWDLAMTVAIPLWMGSAMVGLAAAAITYSIMYYLICVYRRVHARRVAAHAAGVAPDAPSEAETRNP